MFGRRRRANKRKSISDIRQDGFCPLLPLILARTEEYSYMKNGVIIAQKT